MKDVDVGLDVDAGVDVDVKPKMCFAPHPIELSATLLPLARNLMFVLRSAIRSNCMLR